MAPLRWIVEQPACDAGTAATLFWRAEPDARLARADSGAPDDETALAHAIVRRAEARGYPTRRFGWSPQPHPDLRTAVETVLGRPLPAILIEPAPADEPTPRWPLDLPPALEDAAVTCFGGASGYDGDDPAPVWRTDADERQDATNAVRPTPAPRIRRSWWPFRGR